MFEDGDLLHWVDWWWFETLLWCVLKLDDWKPAAPTNSLFDTDVEYCGLIFVGYCGLIFVRSKIIAISPALSNGIDPSWINLFFS